MKASYLVFAFWFVLGAAAGQTPIISVRIYNYAAVPEEIMQQAKLESQRVFRITTLEIQWVDCPLRNGQTEPQYLACITPMSPADIILRIVPLWMETKETPGHSLGYALPFAGRAPTQAYVLYDRVREKLRNCYWVSEFSLLGYVMAHEVAHLLLADDRHHRHGVMMASWEEKDLVEIESGTMAFSRDEARLLKSGGIARTRDNRQP